MSSAMRRGSIVVVVAICLLSQTSPSRGYETTYGEDPVPTTGFYPGYINLGYGVDPIPAKTLCERWHAWRVSRGLSPSIRNIPCDRAATAGARTATSPIGGKPPGVRSTRLPRPTERLP